MKRTLALCASLIAAALVGCSKSPTAPAPAPFTPAPYVSGFTLVLPVYDDGAGTLALTIVPSINLPDQVLADTCWVNINTLDASGTPVQFLAPAPATNWAYSWTIPASPASAAEITMSHVYYAPDRRDTLVTWSASIIHQP